MGLQQNKKGGTTTKQKRWDYNKTKKMGLQQNKKDGTTTKLEGRDRKINKNEQKGTVVQLYSVWVWVWVGEGQCQNPPHSYVCGAQAFAIVGKLTQNVLAFVA